MALGPLLPQPAADNGFQQDFVVRVAASFARVTGGDLLKETGLAPAGLGAGLWNGDFALLTHRGGEAAMLNYANRFALNLWQMDWAQLTATPSGVTAPAQDTENRDRLMAEVAANNFVRGYSGRRVSRTGKLFVIEDVTVWRLLDETGTSFGVAAFFKRYRSIPSTPGLASGATEN